MRAKAFLFLTLVSFCIANSIEEDDDKDLTIRNKRQNVNGTQDFLKQCFDLAYGPDWNDSSCAPGWNYGFLIPQNKFDDCLQTCANLKSQQIIGSNEDCNKDFCYLAQEYLQMCNIPIFIIQDNNPEDQNFNTDETYVSQCVFISNVDYDLTYINNRLDTRDLINQFCPASAQAAKNDTGLSQILGIICDFENQSMCSYQNEVVGANGHVVTQNWTSVKGSYQNSLTGIKKAAQGDYFAAVYLKPKDNAQMMVNATLRKNFVVTLQGYWATQGTIFVAGCLDENGLEILYKTTGNVNASDYNAWKNVTLSIQSSACSNFFIGAYNNGQNRGAVGVDNIQLSYNCSFLKVANLERQNSSVSGRKKRDTEFNMNCQTGNNAVCLSGKQVNCQTNSDCNQNRTIEFFRRMQNKKNITRCIKPVNPDNPNICACKAGQIWVDRYGCVKKVKGKIYYECIQGEHHCQWIQRSVCSNNLCKCGSGYKRNNDLSTMQCVSDPKSCLNSKYCKNLMGKTAKCINGICTCSDPNSYVENLGSIGKCLTQEYANQTFLLFSEPNYAGENVTLTMLNQCTNLSDSNFDKKAASLFIHDGACVILFENNDCTGQFIPFYSSEANLSATSFHVDIFDKYYNFLNMASAFMQCDLPETPPTGKMYLFDSQEYCRKSEIQTTCVYSSPGFILDISENKCYDNLNFDVSSRSLKLPLSEVYVNFYNQSGCSASGGTHTMIYQKDIPYLYYVIRDFSPIKSYQLIERPAKGSFTLFSETNFQGTNVTLPIPTDDNCHNLDEAFNNKASSILINNPECIMLFEDSDCHNLFVAIDKNFLDFKNIEVAATHIYDLDKIVSSYKRCYLPNEYFPSVDTYK
uniref:Uncharacterized protein n=1 Tax=Acrobeloides nanus TaxID=290746 RepID=A0A914DA69_9BILA